MYELAVRRKAESRSIRSLRPLCKVIKKTKRSLDAHMTLEDRALPDLNCIIRLDSFTIQYRTVLNNINYGTGTVCQLFSGTGTGTVRYGTVR